MTCTSSALEQDNCKSMTTRRERMKKGESEQRDHNQMTQLVTGNTYVYKDKMKLSE